MFYKKEGFGSSFFVMDAKFASPFMRDYAQKIHFKEC